jgi:hypothetical protein
LANCPSPTPTPTPKVNRPRWRSIPNLAAS